MVTESILYSYGQSCFGISPKLDVVVNFKGTKLKDFQRCWTSSGQDMGGDEEKHKGKYSLRSLEPDD